MGDNGTGQKPKSKIGKIILIIFLSIVAIIVGFMVIGMLAMGDVDTDSEEYKQAYEAALQSQEDNADYSDSSWISKAQDSAKNYMNEMYNGGSSLLYDWKEERAWFVEAEYDYSQDETYKSNDFTHGYYVCEGAFDYDIPGDGKTEKYPVKYKTSVFVTDNANDYRFVLRSVTLEYDGVEIDYQKNYDFFTK